MKRAPIYYGWVQVALTLLAGAFSSGAGFWAFGVFVKPMGEDLGWSRAEIYAAMTIRALAAGALAPLMGPLQDSRLGPRFFYALTAVSLSASMIAMRWIEDLGTYYVIFGGLGALATFGSTEMMLSVVLPRWFVRRRGRALAIGSMGTALGPLMFPFIVSSLLSLFAWRDAWVALGIISLAVLGPMSLLVRTRPSDLGLQPDGDGEDSQHEAARPGIHPETGYTRSQVLRMQCFWLLIIATSLTTLGTGGFHANWLPYFSDLGFTAGQASLAATAYGICSVSTRIFWGWLAERFAVRYMMALQAFLTALSVLLFLNIDSQPTLLLAAASNGLALGGIFVMRPMMIAGYFGRAHLGAVNGVMRPFLTLSSAGSPLLVAWLYDRQGNYEGVFWVVAACWFAAAAASLVARPSTGASTAGTIVAGRETTTA